MVQKFNIPVVGFLQSKKLMQRHNGTTATCLFLILVDSFCFFPDVVDSRFTEQVDTLLDSLTPLLKRLHPWGGIRSPYLEISSPYFC